MNQEQSSRLFAKRYPNAATTDELTRRTNVARLYGVISPKIEAVKDNNTILFERVDGDCGIELLQMTNLRDLIAPLIALHKIDQEKFPRFDPFLRIEPRVATLSIPPGLINEIKKRKHIEFPTTGVVHGDFHLRQLIRDSEGNCWILDLDDLALGPIEADLGNLAAYLATNPATIGESMQTSLYYWKNKITGAWNDLGQSYQEDWLLYFMQLALIRRTLKLLEAGDDSLIEECMKALLTPG